MKNLIVILSIIFLHGCVASSGQLLAISEKETQCRPGQHERVQIQNYKLGITTSTWTYYCNDQWFNCYASDTLKNPYCRQVLSSGDAVK